MLLIKQHGLTGLLRSVWPYVLIVAATIGVILSQSAFRAARLDYSLPPISAAEPITSIVLGVWLLGDVLSYSRGGLAIEALCLVAMIAGVVLIGRSPALADGASAGTAETPQFAQQKR
jgi:hypothetical protein